MEYKTGRPRKYKSVKEMQDAIDSYFNEECKLNETDVTLHRMPKVTGLAYHLGFTSRQDLINYEGYSQDFHDTLKRAKLFIEMCVEDKLYGNNATGPIFALKNFGWKDKQEIDMNAKVGDLNSLTEDELDAKIQEEIKKMENK